MKQKSWREKAADGSRERPVPLQRTGARPLSLFNREPMPRGVTKHQVAGPGGGRPLQAGAQAQVVLGWRLAVGLHYSGKNENRNLIFSFKINTHCPFCFKQENRTRNTTVLYARLAHQLWSSTGTAGTAASDNVTRRR